MSLAPIAVVTGGAGFIGSHVVDRLVAAGMTVRVIDDLSTGSAANVARGVILDEMDVAAPETAAHIAGLAPAVVVHCAAQASVSASFRDPAADARTNIVGSLNVIRGALEGGVERFVYVTTGGALYGHPEALPCDEDHRVAPLSPYGWSKWIVERYLAILAADRISWMALRLANVYGPRQAPGGEAGVVAVFADAMRRGETVVIEGDGRQTRDFVYVADVVEAVVAAVASRETATLNIGTGRETSIEHLFRDLAAIAGYGGRAVHGPARVGDIRRSALAAGRAAETLGWHPRTDLRDGLRETYEALGRR